MVMVIYGYEGYHFSPFHFFSLYSMYWLQIVHCLLVVLETLVMKPSFLSLIMHCIQELLILMTTLMDGHLSVRLKYKHNYYKLSCAILVNFSNSMVNQVVSVVRKIV